jgi:hypothetical protein
VLIDSGTKTVVRSVLSSKFEKSVFNTPRAAIMKLSRDNATFRKFYSKKDISKFEMSNDRLETNMTNNYTQTPRKFESKTDLEEPIPELITSKQIDEKDSYSKMLKTQIMKLNTSMSKYPELARTNYKNFIKFEKNKNVDELYTTLYTSRDKSRTKTVNYVDPLASDDFHRVFNTFNYYNCFTNSQFPKKKESDSSKITFRNLQIGNLTMMNSYSGPSKLHNKKEIYFKGKIFSSNSKNLIIKKFKNK